MDKEDNSKDDVSLIPIKFDLLTALSRIEDRYI